MRQRTFAPIAYAAAVIAYSTCTWMLPRVVQAQAFDVNDVSYLWPPPVDKTDVDGLISADQPLADDGRSVWPQALFDAVIKRANTITVTNSADAEEKIDFRPIDNEVRLRHNWKVAAVRIDPSAPGTAPMVTAAFGTVPQVRLVLQPVLVDDDGNAQVHDLAAHLVFNFVERFEPQPGGRGLPRAIPDMQAFGAIIADLRALKQQLSAVGVTTVGKLSVHPGFRENSPTFADGLKAVLRKHLREEKLAAIAFMGLNTPEPWIFFAMTIKDGAPSDIAHPALGGMPAQMLTFRGGVPVMPVPTARNIDANRGVSTALLFPALGEDVTTKLKRPVFDDAQRPTYQDIPDIIANPLRSHFFNTDCVSCHSESVRRSGLGIMPTDNQFAYELPANVSGGDDSLLPQSKWNVRNLGWFPARGKPAVATITVRTANESAEAAAYINVHYAK